MKLHWTTYGRVVYDRKKHYFAPKDVARIQKGYFKSLEDRSEVERLVSLRQFWTGISYKLLEEVAKSQRLPEDLNYLYHELEIILGDVIAATIMVQKDFPGNAGKWRLLVKS